MGCKEKEIDLSKRERAIELIIDVGRRLCEHGYVVANDGNISVKLSPNHIMVTPTGVSKGDMTPDMMVDMDLDGNVIKGSLRPSSEVKMHLRVFKENDSVNAVVHAHPIYATSFAVAGIPLDAPILSEAVINLGAVPVVKYACPGSQGVPDGIAPFCKDYCAVLMSNHGALTWGASLEEAYRRMEVLENYAQITAISHSLGSQRLLSSAQVEALASLRSSLGLADVVMPGGVAIATNDIDVLSSKK